MPDLSAPVDVYSDWIDACDAVAKEGGDAGSDDGGNPYEQRAAVMGVDRGLATAGRADEYEDDVGDD